MKSSNINSPLEQSLTQPLSGQEDVISQPSANSDSTATSSKPPQSSTHIKSGLNEPPYEPPESGVADVGASDGGTTRSGSEGAAVRGRVGTPVGKEVGVADAKLGGSVGAEEGPKVGRFAESDNFGKEVGLKLSRVGAAVAGACTEGLENEAAA